MNVSAMCRIICRKKKKCPLDITIFIYFLYKVSIRSVKDFIVLKKSEIITM